MRIKTKLAETPPTPGPSAEPRRARPGSKMSPLANAKRQLVEPGDAARAGNAVRSRAAPHPPPAWEAPPRNHKSGGVWVRARRIMSIASYALVRSCPAASLCASIAPPFCYCFTTRAPVDARPRLWARQERCAPGDRERAPIDPR